MGIRRFNVLYGCVLFPITAAGQTALPGCDPMAPPAQVIQVPRTLCGQVRVARGAGVPVRTYAAQLLRALADRFALPSPLKLGVWGAPPTRGQTPSLVSRLIRGGFIPISRSAPTWSSIEMARWVG